MHSFYARETVVGRFLIIKNCKCLKLHQLIAFQGLKGSLFLFFSFLLQLFVYYCVLEKSNNDNLILFWYVLFEDAPKFVTLKQIEKTGLKKIFYIFLFIAGFHFNSKAQVKQTFVNDSENKVVKFYPNPANSYINFEFSFDNTKTYTLLIYNFIGKKMIELKPSESKITVELTNFYRGVYIFQIRDVTGNIIESGKFQVVK